MEKDTRRLGRGREREYVLVEGRLGDKEGEGWKGTWNLRFVAKFAC